MGLVVSEKKIFSCKSHYKSMADNDTPGRDLYGPRGTDSRTYKKDHYGSYMLPWKPEF